MAGNGRREAGTRELFWREHVAGWEKSGQSVRGWSCGTGGVVMLDFLPFGCVRLNLVAVLCTVAPFVAVGAAVRGKRGRTGVMAGRP